MARRTAAVAIAVTLVFLFSVGCSRTEESELAGETAQEESAEVGAEVDTTGLPTDAARSRGVPVPDEGGDDAPDIVLDGLVYEWKTSPQVGLQFTLDFVNPYETYERARGHLFVIAWYSQTPSRLGVYPWNEELVDNEPVDFSGGTRLLFRKDQRVKAFIPYSSRDGYYDQMRVLVYDDEGAKVVDAHYSLEVTGEPSGAKTPRPMIAL